MGNPIKSVSRSSDTVSRKGKKILKSNKIKDKEKHIVKKKNKKIKSVPKKRSELDVMAEFEKNIIEQTAEVSEEADKVFGASIKSEVNKKVVQKEIGKKIPYKGEEIVVKEESMEEILSDLDDILKVSDTKVKKMEDLKIESDAILAVSDPIKEIENENFGEKVEIVGEFSAGEDTNIISNYDYKGINTKEISFSSTFIKNVKVSLTVDNPDYLGGKNDLETRVIYVSKIHPLYNKIIRKINRKLSFMYIRSGLLSDIIFRNALEILYNVKESYYFSCEPFRVQTEEYRADIVISDIILDYQDTAYYVLLEIIDKVEIGNMILINVDIIFSI